tara:strand:+ start:5769 stop:6416 length:648 start_codon:yes stop_codon:yes gene_type:complete
MSLIVSKLHKYIFFHLPKNAGVSVSKMLIGEENSLKIKKLSSFFFRKLFKTKDNYYFSLKEKKIKFFNSHLPCYEFEEIIGERVFSEYLKFAVIRNPWSRMVSRYSYSKKIDNYFKDFSFNEFVDYDLKNNMHIINQYEFCTDKNNNFCLDKIIKFENINEDFNEISQKFFNKKNMLSHLNRSTYTDYKEYYDNTTKDKIYKYNKRDIEFFEYEF